MMPSISGYFLLRHIDTGGFGNVYQAVSLRDRRNVAIKMLNRTDVKSMGQFVREAKILSRHINNKFVCSILDYNFRTSIPYIVLEYCDSGSLRNWVKERKDWRSVAAILTHVIQGLTGIHRAGGFHRYNGAGISDRWICYNIG